MIDGVTCIGGLHGLLGRVTLSAGAKICQVTSQGEVARLAGVAFMLQKDQMSQTIAKQICFKTVSFFLAVPY